jgi:hypothetical protein
MINIITAKYLKDVTNDTDIIGILVTNETSNKIVVPLEPANTDYAEILRQVDAGELTIEEAD